MNKQLIQALKEKTKLTEKEMNEGFAIEKLVRIFGILDLQTAHLLYSTNY